MSLQLTAGLNALHKAKVVHRDIAPRNIFVSVNSAGESVFKLGDFGLCKYVEDEKVWISGRKYSPHEAKELLDDDKADLRCDVFSLGVSLFELMTLKLLPDVCDIEKEKEAMRKAVVNDAILRARFGDHLLTVVAHMLAEDLAVRSTAASALQELLAIDTKCDHASVLVLSMFRFL